MAACSRQPAEKAGTAPSPSATALDLPVMPEVVQTVFERNCKLCHGPDGHGIAAVAPDLRPAPRRSAEAWEKYLSDPRGVHPNSKMPATPGLSEAEIAAVAAYLADLTQHNPPPKENEANR